MRQYVLKIYIPAMNPISENTFPLTVKCGPIFWHAFVNGCYKLKSMKPGINKMLEAEDAKPDLKHDNMEFAAPADGEDPLDMDTETLEQTEAEEITADELDLLETGAADEQAAALNSVETDRKADNEVNFETDNAADDDFEQLVSENP